MHFCNIFCDFCCTIATFSKQKKAGKHIRMQKDSIHCLDILKKQ